MADPVPLRDASEIDAPKTTVASAKQDDPWAITDDYTQFEKFGEMTMVKKLKFLLILFVKIVLVLACLYLFVCSLSLMGSAFQVLAGKTAGSIFKNQAILSNPITGLIIGVLVTVLVQSSSTSTSIVTTMVGAEIITVHDAIPIIMGANIGTSVTNTIVSLTQSMDVTEFRKAFAGATVHDIFNLLSVVILLPLEIVSGMFEKMTDAVMDSMLQNYTAEHSKPPDILKVITNPLTKKVIQVNKNVIKDVAKGENISNNVSMVKEYCNKNKTIQCNRDDFVFANTGLSDGAVGAILLIISLVLLCLCLLLMVKILHSMMKGSIARAVKKVINTDFKHPFGWVVGYIAIVVGAGLTFIVQSSSVFTSTMTPLVGIGVISLDRMFPLTLGANIGTTTTAVLAALANDNIRLALQIAFCHFFFNIFGILIWYPLPFMRQVPIKGATGLGNITAKYRWFAVLYLFSVFFIFPAILLGLSFAHLWVMGGILILVGVIVIFAVVVNVLQVKRPSWLPTKLRSWNFLPSWMHSLKPYNKIFTMCCKKKCGNNQAPPNTAESGHASSMV